MRSVSSRLSILTLIILAALYLPMAQAKGGGGGHASGTPSGGRATGAGRGGSGVGGYSGVNNGTSATPDPQAPKQTDKASDTSNYGRGSTK